MDAYADAGGSAIALPGLHALSGAMCQYYNGTAYTISQVKNDKVNRP